MAESESDEPTKKKKAMKKLVKPTRTTRSSWRQFGSDTDEATALVRVLEVHLESDSEPQRKKKSQNHLVH